ncbi:DUF3572 domain-containing protein [Halocynthiibacter sp.]|uniref:DUF3572 domain-containing protein n=1 Tax=Halocynthiibacter sp. TaxID=1979210 RepID=UPI003C5722D2
MTMTQESAETIGLQALAWIVGNEELLPVFLGASGASQDDLRQQAGNTEFLGSVLDFFLMDDAWVTQFCDAINLPYDTVMKARMSLPGGEVINWT